MIYFIVKDPVRWGIEDFLASWGQPLAERIDIVTYEELPEIGELPLGSYVFTQLDDLAPSEVELSRFVWERLEQEPGTRLLNNPSRVLGRYDLLRVLHDSGVNDFRAVRANESAQHLRLPVFVREERRHTGSLTGLIQTPSELDSALGELLLRGWRRNDLLIVEYCDASDGHGNFRKFSAYVVGNEIIPRSILSSTHWMVKGATKTVDEERARAELDYVESNPHLGWLRKVMAVASIGYGRIDYGLVGDRPQAWEINLYPTLVTPSWTKSAVSNEARALRLPARTLFFGRFEKALKAIDMEGHAGRAVSITLSDALLRSLRSDQRRERIRTAHRSLVDKLSGWDPIQPLWRACRPLVSRMADMAGRWSRPD